MPEVTILFFSRAQERTGLQHERRELPQHTSVQAVFAVLAQAYPAAATVFSVSRLAVNHQFAHGEVQLADGDELAVIPPVSGG
jgi:molybdopterin converting factor subunit 1